MARKSGGNGPCPASVHTYPDGVVRHSIFSIGLFAPRNGLVIAALVVGALSIAGAVVLIADLDSPFEGILVVSAEPMQEALARSAPHNSGSAAAIKALAKMRARFSSRRPASEGAV